MNNVEITNLWPINSLITDLKLTLPRNINREIFSTNYHFEEVTITACLLLNRSANQHRKDIYGAFVDAILSTDIYPILELETITKEKTIFLGRLGFVELLFRGNIKKQKRKKGKWYNTDLNLNFENSKEFFSYYRSDSYKLFGYSRSRFESCYYNEIGFPPIFEAELINRLISTKDGNMYAVAIFNDKRKKIRKETADLGLSIDEKYRIVSKNNKVMNSVLEICKKYRNEVKNTKKEKKTKPSSNIPISIRKQVWRVHNGNVGSSGCFVCNNNITALDYECGHIIPRSKGGENTVNNLLPICGTCNKSMSDNHLFEYVQKHFNNLNSKCFYLPSYIEWKSTQWMVI